MDDNDKIQRYADYLVPVNLPAAESAKLLAAV
jgi:hypothetical protein